MTFALFTNGLLDTQGGWHDLREFGTIEECMQTNLRNCDWAHIVDTETGEFVYMKERTKMGQDLSDVSWDPAQQVLHIDPDVPALFRAELSLDELGKLEALGGVVWLQAKIAEAKVAEPPPEANATDLLKFLKSVPLPVHLTESNAVFRAQDLVRDGLVEAVLSRPNGYSATVVAITARGMQRVP